MFEIRLDLKSRFSVNVGMLTRRSCVMVYWTVEQVMGSRWRQAPWQDQKAHPPLTWPSHPAMRPWEETHVTLTPHARQMRHPRWNSPNLKISGWTSKISASASSKNYVLHPCHSCDFSVKVSKELKDVSVE